MLWGYPHSTPSGDVPTVCSVGISPQPAVWGYPHRRERGTPERYTRPTSRVLIKLWSGPPFRLAAPAGRPAGGGGCRLWSLEGRPARHASPSAWAAIARATSVRLTRRDFAEDGQQHHPRTRRSPVVDPQRGPVKPEPQFARVLPNR